MIILLVIISTFVHLPAGWQVHQFSHYKNGLGRKRQYAVPQL